MMAFSKSPFGGMDFVVVTVAANSGRFCRICLGSPGPFLKGLGAVDFSDISVKVLVKLFQKLAQVEAADASSPSAEGETPFRRFFLLSFFFAPLVAKEKAGIRFP